MEKKMTVKRSYRILFAVSLVLALSLFLTDFYLRGNPEDPWGSVIIMTIFSAVLVALVSFLLWGRPNWRLYRVLLFLWLPVYIFFSVSFSFLWGWELSSLSRSGDIEAAGPQWWNGIVGMLYPANFYASFVYGLILLIGMLGVVLRRSYLRSLCVSGTFLMFWSSLFCSFPSAIWLVLSNPPHLADAFGWFLWMVISCSTWIATLRLARAKRD